MQTQPPASTQNSATQTPQASADGNFRRVSIGNASVHIITYRQAIDRILAACASRNSLAVLTPNADHVVMLEHDERLQRAYADADLIVCDGMPLMLAAQLLGDPLPERVTGSDLMPGLCKAGAAAKIKIAIVGGPPGTAELAGKNLATRYPGIEVVWTYCPPLGFERSEVETNKIIAALDQASPDLVFIGVGAPKQELWIHDHRRKFRCGAILGIGAAIEFEAGTIPRAPKWMRRVGLEWLYRFVKEPRRLGKRYLKDFTFFIIIAKQRFLGRT